VLLGRRAHNRLGFALHLLLLRYLNLVLPSLEAVPTAVGHPGARAHPQDAVHPALHQRSRVPDRVLNKGEVLHALAREVCYARQGIFRERDLESLLNKASCLSLVINAIVVWNTRYMMAALDHLRGTGYPVRDEDLAFLSSLIWEHINMHGTYHFDLGGGATSAARCNNRPGDHPPRRAPGRLPSAPSGAGIPSIAPAACHLRASGVVNACKDQLLG
jgi:hypothetical protein